MPLTREFVYMSMSVCVSVRERVKGVKFVIVSCANMSPGILQKNGSWIGVALKDLITHFAHRMHKKNARLRV